MLGTLPFSSTNATIKFDNQVIGYLQNFRLKEDFAVKQVNSIGSNIPIGFVSGSYIGEAFAKKAFIETNLLLDVLKPAVNATTAYAMGLRDFTEFIPEGTQEVTNFVLDIANVAGQVISQIKGDNINKNSFMLMFDIEVTTLRSPDELVIENGNISIQTDTEISNLQESTVILLKDCVIATREVSIDINDIIVMDNISIRITDRVQ